jgi:hypothetical protein
MVPAIRGNKGALLANDISAVWIMTIGPNPIVFTYAVQSRFHRDWSVRERTGGLVLARILTLHCPVIGGGPPVVQIRSKPARSLEPTNLLDKKNAAGGVKSCIKAFLGCVC